jgi:colicin import membrane protein
MSKGAQAVEAAAKAIREKRRTAAQEDAKKFGAENRERIRAADEAKAARQAAEAAKAAEENPFVENGEAVPTAPAKGAKKKRTRLTNKKLRGIAKRKHEADANADKAIATAAKKTPAKVAPKKAAAKKAKKERKPRVAKEGTLADRRKAALEGQKVTPEFLRETESLYRAVARMEDNTPAERKFFAQWAAWLSRQRRHAGSRVR